LGVDGDRVVLVERAPEPSKVLARLAELAPWLTLIHVPEQHTPRARIEGSGKHGEVSFIGPIEGRAVEALVMLLRALATGEVPFDTPATPGLLRELSTKVGVGVHVTATCPYCPAVTQAALRLALASPYVDVVVVRADIERSALVHATPTVVMNGKVVSTGPVSEYDLAQKVIANAS
jgi:alkyl hydroperoxide reductase subunit AhpF